MDAFEAALTVTTKEAHPHHFVEIQDTLALLHLDWSRHESCDAPAAHLQTARAHVETALEVYDPEHTPYHREKATRLRATILAALDQRAGR